MLLTVGVSNSDVVGSAQATQPAELSCLKPGLESSSIRSMAQARILQSHGPWLEAVAQHVRCQFHFWLLISAYQRSALLPI